MNKLTKKNHKKAKIVIKIDNQIKKLDSTLLNL